MATWGAEVDTDITGYFGNSGTLPSNISSLDAFPSDGTITDVYVWGLDNGNGDAYRYRSALYKGGTSATDPDGATLVQDFGSPAKPSAADYPSPAAWIHLASGLSIAALANDRFWLAFKGAYSVSPGYVDAAAGRGHVTPSIMYNVGFGADETVAFSTQTPIGSTGPSVYDPNFAYKWYVVYTAAAAAGAQQNLTAARPSSPAITSSAWREALSGLLVPDRRILTAT